MRRMIAMAALCALLVLAAGTAARESIERPRPYSPVREDEIDYTDIPGWEEGLLPPLSTMTRTEYVLVNYDFEQMDWQGWTQVDLTAQPDTFWHVEDYLEPELAGLPGPLEGTKSLWCGLAPGDDEYTCSWIGGAGYGNGWDQSVVMWPYGSYAGEVTVTFRAVVDTEPDYDRFTFEYADRYASWVEGASFSGTVDTTASVTFLPGYYGTKFRFHFVSDRAYSDQDGLWDTQGAVHLDSIVVSDFEGLRHYEDFESHPDGATTDDYGEWGAEPAPPYGMYSGLCSNLVDPDPCYDNFGSQIVFFIGSPYPHPTYPGLYTTPYCIGPGGTEPPCQDEAVVSPPIDLTMYSSSAGENQDTPIPAEELAGLGGLELSYDWLPPRAGNCVYWQWGVREITGNCPGPWRDDGFIYYYWDLRYGRTTHDISSLVDLSSCDAIQVMVGVVDMCAYWYPTYCTCEDHDLAPYYDNIELVRYGTTGPQWAYRDVDLFQDNFPSEEFNMESWVRIDAALDLRSGIDPVIEPGDSAIVTCWSPTGGGIDTTADGWPAVYCHVLCTYVGDPVSPKPDLAGPSLAGTYGRYVSDDGAWTVLQCEPARADGSVADDQYMIDLDDSLFTRGYMIEYYFSAVDRAGIETTCPEWARAGYWRRERLFEVTCLPTLASDVLYVNDFHGRGLVMGAPYYYWETAFSAVLPPGNMPDRYDVNAPSMLASNGLGSRAKNYYLTTAYDAIVWDGGNLSNGVVTAGAIGGDKSNDAQSLIDWLDFSGHDVGLWLLGDDLATDLKNNASAPAIALLSNWCGAVRTSSSYFELTGGIGGYLDGGTASPMVRGVAGVGNPFWHATWGDSLYVFGGCPIVNDFDVLGAVGAGEYALAYPDYGGEPHYAAISASQVNSMGFDCRTIVCGFSMMYTRDAAGDPPAARHRLVNDAFGFFEQDLNADITGADDAPPAVTALGRAWPNPFNPVTTISFSLRAKGHARLRIYDVTGRLVRILVDETRPAGTYEARWDGRNEGGRRAASGVYFCRFEAPGYEKTIKTVLLR